MSFVAMIGRRVTNRVMTFGDFCRFCGQAWSWLPAGMFRGRNLRMLLPQFYEVATRSIPVVMITGAFVGMVLAVQAYNQFKSINMEAKMGPIVIISVLRELGPVLAGVMLAGRVGGALTAELGTMRVTEQIDALRAMGADPLRVLVVPRFLACTLMIPVLVTYASFTGALGGYGISVYLYGVNGHDFWENTKEAVTLMDILQGPIKCVFFGAAMSLICCYNGFRCRAGAAGVGRACTESFVASCMAILALDFFLGMFLNAIDLRVFGLRALIS